MRGFCGDRLCAAPGRAGTACDESPHAHGCHYLGHHGVLSIAQKRFYLEVLFNPFEEQFNLPSLFVNIGDRFCWPGELIANEDIVFAC